MEEAFNVISMEMSEWDNGKVALNFVKDPKIGGVPFGATSCSTRVFRFKAKREIWLN